MTVKHVNFKKKTEASLETEVDSFGGKHASFEDLIMYARKLYRDTTPIEAGEKPKVSSLNSLQLHIVKETEEETPEEEDFLAEVTEFSAITPLKDDK